MISLSKYNYRHSLYRELDSLVRKIVLVRDKNTCQKCNTVFSDDTDLACSHVITKPGSDLLRWDLDNVKLLCHKCHIGWWHSNPQEAVEWFGNKFPQRFANINAKRYDISTMKKHDLVDLKRNLKIILSELEEKRRNGTI